MRKLSFANEVQMAFLSVTKKQSASAAARGQSGTITAVVNELAKAEVDLGENASLIPSPKGKGR